MAGMGGYADEGNTEKPFRNDSRYFQAIKLLQSPLGEDRFYCSAEGARPVKTKDGGSDFTCEIERVPIRVLDGSGQGIATEVFDDSPARQEFFALDGMRRRQLYGFLDENGLGFIDVWHFKSPNP
jgi:hypothetical protein